MGLPPGWAKATIPELIGRGGTFCDGDWIESKDQDPHGEVRLIQLADVGDGWFKDRSERFLTKFKSHELNCTYLQERDVLISRLADPLGRCCLFPGLDQTCVTAVDVCIVRTGGSGIDAEWLSNQINSPEFRQRIEGKASGTTRKRISRSNLGSLSIPVPPVAEQRRIASKVRETRTRADAARAALDAIPPLLDRFRQSVLAAAFRGDLTADWREENPHQEPASKPMFGARHSATDLVDSTELPDLPPTWCWASVADVADVEGGIQKQPSRRVGQAKFPFLRVANVYWGRLDLSDVHEIELFDGELERLRLEEGDLLVVEGNGSPSEVGRMAIWDGSIDDCVHQNHLIRVRPRASIRPEFLAHFWSSPVGRERVFRNAQTTTGLYNLSKGKVLRLPIPLPPPNEQDLILSRLTPLLEFASSVEARCQGAQMRLHTLHQSILSRAFRGELVPQDPDDEPASVLLERIRAEREAAGTNGKPRRGRRKA